MGLERVRLVNLESLLLKEEKEPLSVDPSGFDDDEGFLFEVGEEGGDLPLLTPSPP